MDSVHKLIEMLEKRFGKFWADALLLCTVLGAAAWGLHGFMVFLVLPTIRGIIAAYGWLSGVNLSLSPQFFQTFDVITTTVTLLMAISIGVSVTQIIFTTIRMGKRLNRTETGLSLELEENCTVIRAQSVRIAELEAKNAELTDAAAKLLAVVQVRDRAPNSS